MILQLIALAIFLVVLWKGIGLLARRQGGRRQSRRRWRCDDCRHLVKAFDDGALCGYRGRVFKNPVHIQNCMDWESSRS